MRQDRPADAGRTRGGRQGPAAGGFDAVVLAGGRARRAGGVDKPGLVVGGRTIAAAVVAAAVAAGAWRVVLVGPERPELLAVTGAPGPAGDAPAVTRAPGSAGDVPAVTRASGPAGDAPAVTRAPGPTGDLPAARVIFVREEPPGAGPVPALARGLVEARAPMVAVLAADLPFLAAQHLEALLAAVGDGGGAIMVDDAGREQWLLGCWRTGTLREALRGYRGHSLHGLLRPLAPEQVRWQARVGEPPPWLDCDTLEDVERARRWQAALTLAGDDGRHEGREGAPVSTVDHWVEAACGELGLDPAEIDARALLDFARDVAHGVDRPAAPLTAYLLGIAVGRGQPVPEAMARLRELAVTWGETAGS